MTPEVGKFYWVDTPGGMKRSYFLTEVHGGFKGQLYDTNDSRMWVWITRSKDVIAEVEPENIPTRMAAITRSEPFFIFGNLLAIVVGLMAAFGAWVAVMALLMKAIGGSP